MDEIGQMEAEFEDRLKAARAEGYAAGELSNRRYLLEAEAKVETARLERASAVARAERAEVDYKTIVRDAWEAFGQETRAVVNEELPWNPTIADAIKLVIAKTGGLKHPAFR